MSVAVSAAAASALGAVEDELAGEIAEVERILAERMGSNVELIEQANLYLHRSGGKRLRPVFVLLSARAAGGTGEGAPSYAAIAEMIHTATLVHDDIVDQADMRRGRASVNHMLGNDLTVLIGDYLFIRALSLAVELGNQRIVAAICDLTLRMIEGMLLETARGGTLGLTREEHLRILDLKTASLFEGCGAIGARLADASAEVEHRLASFGRNLGMAFQVADDVLDFAATAEDVGKPVLSDLKEGHLTLPILHALDLEPEAAPMVEEVLRNRELDESTGKAILGLVHRQGGIEEARRVAGEYADAAQQAIQGLPPSRYVDALSEFATLAVDRNH